MKMKVKTNFAFQKAMIIVQVNKYQYCFYQLYACCTSTSSCSSGSNPISTPYSEKPDSILCFFVLLIAFVSTSSAFSLLHHSLLSIYLKFLNFSVYHLLLYKRRTQNIYANTSRLFRFPNCSIHNDVLLQENNDNTTIDNY